jgi:hypothetical protein
MIGTTDALLAGPRGRRVCFEIARGAGDAELARAIFVAAHGAPRPGLASIVLSAGADATPTTPVTPADVARLFAGIRTPEPSPSRLFRALRAAVDSARYWQEPDDEDELAAAPELRAALAGVAAVIVASPHTAWWRGGADLTAQYRVDFEADDETPVAAETVLADWRTGIAAEVHRAELDRPADPTARISGAWWSMPPRRLTRSARARDAVPVGLDLVEDTLGWTTARTERIRLPAAPRVYEIDGPEAWAALCADGIDVTPARRHDWYRATGRDGTWLLPDWTRVASEYDAVHLSVAGYLETAGRAIPVGRSASVLAGWTPDETVWLRDVEREPGSRQRWSRDSPSEPWRRQEPAG